MKGVSLQTALCITLSLTVLLSSVTRDMDNLLPIHIARNVTDWKGKQEIVVDKLFRLLVAHKGTQKVDLKLAILNNSR